MVFWTSPNYLKLKQEFDSRIQDEMMQSEVSVRKSLLCRKTILSIMPGWIISKNLESCRELTRWAAAITINRILAFEDNRIKIVFNFEDAFMQAQELLRGLEMKEGV